MNRIERWARNSTPIGKAESKYRQYRAYDSEHGFNADEVIPVDEIVRLCYSEDSKCVYCGCRSELGADRIDNTKGHTRDNVVCACRSCNKARGDSFTYADFKEITQRYK